METTNPTLHPDAPSDEDAQIIEEMQQQMNQFQQQLMIISNKRDVLIEQNEMSPRVENKVMEYENMMSILLNKIKKYKLLN